MPAPDLVREYEVLYPGAAGFFFDALSRQSRHRQDMEERIIEAGIAHEAMGMWLAFILAMLLVVCGTFLIYRDKDPQGLALVGGTLVALCGVFIVGRARAGPGSRPRGVPPPGDE